MRREIAEQPAAVAATLAQVAGPAAALAAAVRARELDRVVLVARGSGVESFGETVILALPLEDGGHIGFVLNMPTEATVHDLFPEDDASSKGSTRVDVGGPALTNTLFALVVDPGSDIEGLRRVSPQFAVALASDEVDRVIAKQMSNTRFFMGLFVWTPGGLEQQVKAGAWSVLAPDARIVLSARPATLWQRLSQGSERLVLFRFPGGYALSRG
jgi:putative transcriptional regulator